MKKIFLLATVLITCSLTVAAEIYKWVDAEGKVHYSQHAATQGQCHESESQKIPRRRWGGGTPSATADYWKQKDARIHVSAKKKNTKRKTNYLTRSRLDDADKRKKTCEF